MRSQVALKAAVTRKQHQYEMFKDLENDIRHLRSDIAKLVDKARTSPAPPVTNSYYYASRTCWYISRGMSIAVNGI